MAKKPSGKSTVVTGTPGAFEKQQKAGKYAAYGGSFEKSSIGTKEMRSKGVIFPSVDGQFSRERNRGEYIPSGGAFERDPTRIPTDYQYVESSVYPYLLIESLRPGPVRALKGITYLTDPESVFRSGPAICVGGTLQATVVYSSLNYPGLPEGGEKFNPGPVVCLGGTLTVTLVYSSLSYPGLPEGGEKINPGLAVCMGGNMVVTTLYVEYMYDTFDPNRLAPGRAVCTGGTLA